ncbi:IQ motif and SEC7 domain-containing protein 1 isoform X3 [Centruroides vittatus]|uniref:IQ motif and SEC7 domain-containing protein 1 isoform X3 n=1 Tax=Centruroides vittatus TaxID=120091 RepID=UPI00350FCB7B
MNEICMARTRRYLTVRGTYHLGRHTPNVQWYRRNHVIAAREEGDEHTQTSPSFPNGVALPRSKRHPPFVKDEEEVVYSHPTGIVYETLHYVFPLWFKMDANQRNVSVSTQSMPLALHSPSEGDRLVSSGQPPDHLSCPHWPPIKQLRSYSVDAGGQPLIGLRQRIVGANAAVKKTPVRRLDEEALKRSRLHANQYELSQDLLDKQVEMLERKYGGVRARDAALTIQRAFRKYCMMKRFRDIANASKGEKRLSRRFYNLEAEGKDWIHYNGSSNHHCQQKNLVYNEETMVSNVSGSTHSNPCVDTRVKNNFSTLYRELSDSVGDNKYPSKQNRVVGNREQQISEIDRTRMDKITKTKDILSHGAPPCPGRMESDVLHLTKTTDVCTKSELQEAGTPLDSSMYHTPPSRLPPSVPRHPAWSAVSPCTSAGIRQSSGPTIYLSPSQNSSSVEDQYHTPRESLSSEDSAISSAGPGECDSLSDDHRSLCRDCYARRSINVPLSSTKDQVIGMHHTISRPDITGRKIIAPAGDLRKSIPRLPRRTPSASAKWSDSPSEMSPHNNFDSSHVSHEHGVEVSPVWKRKSLVLSEQIASGSNEDKRLSNISENSEDSLEGMGYSNSLPTADMYSPHGYGEPGARISGSELHQSASGFKVSEIQRKRQYRVGLNLFNKKPERGVRYLIQRGFLEASPQAVARFLVSRKGLSKQMIGEYLGNLQNPFNMAVLECFVQELDLAGMQVDVALRKFQTFFRMPGEAQKIERLVEVFSHRYIECNRDIVAKLQNADTVFVLAFAIIMLNTDSHTPNMKAEKRMKLEDFIKNLRGVDDGNDLDRDMLVGIYERIKGNEFKPGSDHVTQVLKVQQTIVGKKPNLALPHRRLVCYCRLYEVYDVNKKERPGIHQREVFLFNDMLMVTKIFSKKKNSVTYTFRQSFPLCGMSVTLFEAPYYPHGIRLSQRVDDKVLITFNARNEHDRSKFVEDLKESILEMDEMENLRIEAELEKQKVMRARGAENRDSGVADMEIVPVANKEGKLSPDSQSNNLKRSALSNSLLDLHEQQAKPVRRGSAGSLDSGMSVSFQSSTASTVSHDSSPQTNPSTLAGRPGHGEAAGPSCSGTKPSSQQGFLGGLFGKKGKVPHKPPVRRTADTTDI